MWGYVFRAGSLKQAKGLPVLLTSFLCWTKPFPHGLRTCINSHLESKLMKYNDWWAPGSPSWFDLSDDRKYLNPLLPQYTFFFLLSPTLPRQGIPGGSNSAFYNEHPVQLIFPFLHNSLSSVALNPDCILESSWELLKTNDVQVPNPEPML